MFSLRLTMPGTARNLDDDPNLFYGMPLPLKFNLATGSMTIFRDRDISVLVREAQRVSETWTLKPEDSFQIEDKCGTQIGERSAISRDVIWTLITRADYGRFPREEVYIKNRLILYALNNPNDPRVQEFTDPNWKMPSAEECTNDPILAPLHQEALKFAQSFVRKSSVDDLGGVSGGAAAAADSEPAPAAALTGEVFDANSSDEDCAG